MWTCKHCNKKFDFERATDKANHSRWCDKNPKAKKFKENNKLRASETANKRYGVFKQFTVECATCHCDMDVEEREKLHPSKDVYYCSRKCANSVGGTAKAQKYHPDEIAHYRAVMLRYHKPECLVCGFDKVVDCHHVDENHDNTNPKNLVPLCPNHHKMVHIRRYKNEIKSDIKQYLKTWNKNNCP